jgi:hypothetical protein
MPSGCGANNAACAGAILDHHRLAEPRAELVRHQPHDEIE